MSKNTRKRTSSKSNAANSKTSSEETEKTFKSNTTFDQNSSIKKVQLEIKMNLTIMLNNTEPKFPHSQTIFFQLNPKNPILPSSSKEIQTNIFKSELYYNPKLEEKISQLQPTLHVDLSYCDLTDSDVLIIVNQIITGKKCTDLWLYGNKITSQGAAMLSSSLINNSTLKSLDLSFNQISDVGVRLLTQALSPNQNSFLKILYLSKSGISDDGVTYLSEMLKTNQTLTELWLSSNEIGNKGVKQLADVLANHNKTLKFLSLSMNIFITDLSIDYLIEMFELNQRLKKFWMIDCNLTEQGKIKLHEKADQKKKFQIEL